MSSKFAVSMRTKHEDPVTAMEVSTRQLTDTLSTGWLEHVLPLKGDVEGAEWHVVQGMNRLLGRCSPDFELAIEISGRVRKPQGASA